MPRKKQIEEEQEIEEEVEVPEPIIKKRTNRKLILKEEAENGSDTIQKIIQYKKLTSDKQKKHLDVAREANKKKIQETKKKMTEFDLLQKENQLLKMQLDLNSRMGGIQETEPPKPKVKAPSKPKEEQIEIIPKPLWAIM